MIIALVLLLEPNILLSQIHWGVAPTWSQFLYGLAMGTVAYTGIETISNMAEEAAAPGQGRAAIHQLRHHRRARRLHRHAAGGALLHAGRVQHGAGGPRDGHDRAHPGGPRRARRHVPAQVGPQRGRLRPAQDAGGRDHRDPGAAAQRRRPDGRRTAGDQAVRHPAGQQLRRRPGAGHGALPAGRRLLAARHPGSVGRHPRRHHPLHRHQCRAHRRLPSRLLAGPAPPAAACARARRTPRG